MVWPRRCGVCGGFLDTEERYVCAECLKDMPLTYFWSWRGNPAEQILWARTYLEGVVSLFYYFIRNFCMQSSTAAMSPPAAGSAAYWERRCVRPHIRCPM